MTAKAATWKPATQVEREAVTQHLRKILESRHFRTSKRSTAFLEHIVLRTIEGQEDTLKERLLGVDVFKRAPDYDTNADPVVRMTAGEVRKRIAQYYHEVGSPADFRIDLDPGTYVPEFRMIDSPLEPLETSGDSPPVEVVSLAPAFSDQHRSRPRPRWKVALAVLLVASLSVFLACLWLAKPRNPVERLWAPFVQSQEPPLVLTGIPLRAIAEAEEEEGTQSMAKDGHSHTWVAMSDAMVLSHAAGVMDAHNRPYRVRVANFTSITDLRHRPLILIGAFNNPWTLRLTQDLRFSFDSVQVNGVLQTARIVDHKNPASNQWQVASSAPEASKKSDFAIVGRFRSATTEDNVLVIAGLGFNATEGAGEVIVSNDQLRQIETLAPRGWSGNNFEAVIEVRIVDGKLAGSKVVTATFW